MSNLGYKWVVRVSISSDGYQHAAVGTQGGEEIGRLEVVNDEWPIGLAMVNSGYHFVEFDNFAVDNV